MKEVNKQPSGGFSFIEIIISMTIISILITIFFPVIANSFHGIVASGKISRAILQLQTDTESNLLITSTQFDDPLKIDFGANTIEVEGERKEITSISLPYSITIFKPH